MGVCRQLGPQAGLRSEGLLLVQAIARRLQARAEQVRYPSVKPWKAAAIPVVADN